MAEPYSERARELIARSEAHKAWREAHKEEITHRVALFKTAYSALCDEHGLCLQGDDMWFEDTTRGDLGPIWVADNYETARHY